MDEQIMIGSNTWNALQAALDERKDCIDRISLIEAIEYDSRIYGRPSPIWTDFTGDSFAPLSAIISAMQNYMEVTEADLYI